MTRIRAALCVSALLAGLPAGCGGDDDVQSASTPAPKRDAPAAERTGYTVELPGGFRDVTNRFAGTAIKVDLAYVKRVESGFATSFVVIREQPGGEFQLDDVMESFTKQAEAQATEAGFSEVEDRELDGVPAKTYSFLSRNDENGPLRQRQVVAVKGDAIYTITWSVPADEFQAQEATLNRTLASWRWS
jgi:hypothetical protein